MRENLAGNRLFIDEEGFSYHHIFSWTDSIIEDAVEKLKESLESAMEFFKNTEKPSFEKIKKEFLEKKRQRDDDWVEEIKKRKKIRN
ncbi:hypothetical protein HN954_03290 [bacterium]|nr:hypothetical protein [bacterium]MBT6832126.1 hypothetical protein [bacterium]MBT6996428.1 hypothetical protein [bacterium]MBT7772163.1 hypothetical protein [bacterium]